jgi:hypothetical protein
MPDNPAICATTATLRDWHGQSMLGCLEQWIEDKVEIIPLQEKEARKKWKEALEDLNVASSEKKEAERTINIEVREKNTEVKVLKTQLKRRLMNDAERNKLNTRITLLLTVIDEQKKLLKTSKERLKSSEEKVASSRKLLDTLKAERGSVESSLVADIELLLKRIAIERAAYHGGDFDGAYCRR